MNMCKGEYCKRFGLKYIYYLIVISVGLMCSIGCGSDESNVGAMPLPSFSFTDSSGNTLSNEDISRGNIILLFSDDEETDKRYSLATKVFREVSSCFVDEVIVIRSTNNSRFSTKWKSYILPDLKLLLSKTYHSLGCLLVVDGVIDNYIPSYSRDEKIYCILMHNSFCKEHGQFAVHLYSNPPERHFKTEVISALINENSGKFRVFFLNDPRAHCDYKYTYELLENMRLDDDFIPILIFGYNIKPHVSKSILSNHTYMCMTFADDAEINKVWKSFDQLNYKVPTNFLIEYDLDEGDIRSVYLDCETLKEYIYETE